MAEPSEEELEAKIIADLAGGASPEPTPVATEPVVTETPTETAISPEPTPVPDDEHKGRFRLTGKLAAVAELTKSGVPEDEAIERIYGTTQAKAAPVEEAPDPVVALETEHKEIQTRLDAAAEDQSLFTPELRKDLERAAEIKMEIRDAKQTKANTEAAQVQTVQQKWQADWKASEALAAKAFPDHYSDDKSPLNVAVDAELANIVANPDHPYYGNADLPEILFAKHASRLGIAPKATSAKPAEPPTRMNPASGGAKTTPAQQVNAATVAADFAQRQAKAVESGDPEELYQLAEEAVSGKRPARHAALRLA